MFLNDDPLQIIELDDFLERTFISIEILLQRNLFNQALIIMYSAIDTMAWSCKDIGDAERKDFYAWCERHMELEDIGITPLDLYAARCSMLHSNSVHSWNTEMGNCLPFFYVTNPGSKPLQDYAPLSAQEWIVVDLHVLLERFWSGCMEFRRRAMLRPQIRDIVTRRIQQWLHFTHR